MILKKYNIKERKEYFSKCKCNSQKIDNSNNKNNSKNRLNKLNTNKFNRIIHKLIN